MKFTELEKMFLENVIEEKILELNSRIHGGSKYKEDLIEEKRTYEKILKKVEKKFEIKCLKCGSDNVSIEEEIDYDYGENPYTAGYYLKCNDCENEE